jgi:protein SCO1/2
MKDPNPLPQPQISADYAPTKKHGTVLMICAVFMALGGVIFWQYLVKLKSDNLRMKDRPSYDARLKENLKATEMSGKEVDIGQLEGKVWVAGFLYTLCPRGCAGLAMEMKKLQDEFGADPMFQLVSVSLNAEWDTPERLRAWTGTQDFKGDNWWFLTGDGPKLRGYMKDQFKLEVREIPLEKRNSEFDIYDHRLVLVLVDHKRRIRGTYDFSQTEMNDVYAEALRKDLKAVLKEAKEPATPGS